MNERSTIDPTENVKALVVEAMKRQDDLRDAEGRRVNDVFAAEARRVNEILQIRAGFEEQLRLAEANRINAIRAVDVNAVAVASERANQQAAVLATQVAASAEALRALVATTASTIAQQLTQLTTQLTERLAAVEKANYEGMGKSAMADPAMATFMAEMKVLQAAMAQNQGRQGLSMPVVGGAAILVGGLLVWIVEHSVH